MTVILRRRKLGRTSCKEIANQSTTGIICVRNDQPFPEGHDMVIRWGCTTPVGAKKILNKSEAIHVVNDKAAFRKLCADKGLAPDTWLNAYECLKDLFDDGEALTNAVVVRPKRHAQGRNLFVCKTQLELLTITKKLGEGNYYITLLVEKTAEYRVFVVSGRVACVAKKTPANPDDVAWNVAQGGRFDNVGWKEWPLTAIRTAVEAFKLSGLDFGGVDIMIGAGGAAWCLEINSAPSLTSPYRQSCMAKAFDYIVNNGNDQLNVADYKSYLGCIHPAITDNVRI